MMLEFCFELRLILFYQSKHLSLLKNLNGFKLKRSFGSAGFHKGSKCAGTG